MKTYDNNPRFLVDRDQDGLCSYIWVDSPWLQDFNAESIEAMENGVVTHYVLLGGDYNVEVLAYGRVSIDSVGTENE